MSKLLTPHPRIGRAPATTHAELSHTAMALFLRRGFDHTTIDDIAEAAGISRRTFFRYFKSKNDLLWGDFDALIEQMRARLQAVDDSVPTVTALEDAIVAFNSYPSSELPYHRGRMSLLLNVPSLIAHSTLRYRAWREVVAEFVGARRGEDPSALAPQAVSRTYVSLSLTAYDLWLRDEHSDLVALLRETFAAIRPVLGCDSSNG